MKFALISKLDTPENVVQYATLFANQMGKELVRFTAIEDNYQDFAEQNDIDLYFIYCPNRRSDIQHYLNLCRTLRLPYVILTDTMRIENPEQLLLPVTMLEEEVYKAEFAAHIARFHHSTVSLLLANDYGSRARTNANRIQTTLKKMGIEADIIKAHKDSLSLHKEVPFVATDHYSLILLTASREYGLDDLIFGPSEQYVVRHSVVPVMLINPREDLFSLCD